MKIGGKKPMIVKYRLQFETLNNNILKFKAYGIY